MDEATKPRRKKEKAAIRSRLGVIDIGSNSVRLVVYDVYGAALLPCFNQKTMAALGKGLNETGKLSAEGWDMALDALQRYATIIDGLGVNRVRAVATAAVREAEDGKAFVKAVKKLTGLEIDVLSGEDEGKASAAGIKAGFPNPVGLMGDLGGSSVEFAMLGDKSAPEPESYSLGPLAFSDTYDRKVRIAAIKEALSRSQLLNTSVKGKTFFLIGGAWRALARMHMDVFGYDLHFLHGYTFSATDASRLVEATHAIDPASIARVTKAGGRRAASLPYAAVLLDQVVRLTGVREITVSAFGVREGLVRLETGKTKRNMLLDGIELAFRTTPGQREFGKALYDFILPVVPPFEDLFDGGVTDHDMIEAACYLADIGARLHPNSRAKLAYDSVIEGPWAGITHRQRAFLALAAGSRYARRIGAAEAHSRLLSGAREDRARQVGALMRVGATFSGRSADVLEKAKLRVDREHLELIVQPDAGFMVSQTVERRFGYAAALLGVKPVIKKG